MVAMPTYADEVLIKAEPRTLIWTEPMRGGGRQVVKMYRRRHPLDPVRHWFTPFRAEREFGLLAHLQSCHVPCPEPLSWSHAHNRRHGHHEILVTREIPSTVALHELLRSRAPGATDLAPLFAIARRMHECGVAHGAFYAPNILVSLPAAGPARFHLIDFAHGCRFPRGIVGTRPARYDILDMLRSIERFMPTGDRERWVAAYGLGADGTSRLLGRLAHHRIERPWRHFRRAETDAREFFGRFGLVPGG
jgi:hypothetical protein